MKSMFLGIGVFIAALVGRDPAPPAPTTAFATEAVLPEYHQGVVGGPHDFSDAAHGIQDACRACHVPHVQTFRPTTQPAGRAAYEQFRIEGQRRVFEPDRYSPGATSLICLGCHDGTVATSTLGGAHSMLAGVREGFDSDDGFAWRDHPIGVPYSKDRREFHNEAYVLKQGVRLPEGRVECISCHDPHNAKGLPGMLSLSNRKSGLCLTCHIK